jgi:hypothetical protein
MKLVGKPLEIGVGLSSNTWHASVNMVVGENLIGRQYNSCFRWLFRGFLSPYSSPMKYLICCFDIKQNPQNNEEDNNF